MALQFTTRQEYLTRQYFCNNISLLRFILQYTLPCPKWEKLLLHNNIVPMYSSNNNNVINAKLSLII